MKLLTQVLPPPGPDKELLFFASIDVDSHAIKKNSRQIFLNRKTHRPFLGKSRDLEQAEQTMTLQLKSCRVSQGLFNPITVPVWVCFMFHVEQYFTKKGHVSKNLPDLSNLYQLPEDCLVKAGILEDDRLIESHDGSRRFPASKNRLDVLVFRYGPTDSTI